MSQSLHIRFTLPAAILVILAGLYFSLSGPSQTLLSPPPSGYFPVTFGVGAALALFAGYMLAKDIPSRLARRLTLLAIMAFTLFASGVSARGLYAVNAFEGPLETVTESWMVLRSKGDNLVVSSPQRRKAFDLPATPEAVAQANMGQCVSVQIQRSASGAERIAPDLPKVGASDLSLCEALQPL